MASVSYHTVGSNDLEKAKAFYDALLGTIGMKPFLTLDRGQLYSGKDMGLFGVFRPHDGGEACVGNGSMGGFSMSTREEVDAFYAKALELGGTCEGAPGERMPGAYFSYFRDPEGNKLCGFKLG
jgi:catechol 2,3-dioxygenase-like lactoylglutathione lyase family enzyme